MKTTLETIAAKYCGVEYNTDNYAVGGGLDGVKFASNRHEDAKFDSGKLTLGEATQLFKKATGLDVDTVREIIEYAVPNMEWHHAGKLPKQYGGGMKKTYFLNSDEICKVATEWGNIVEKLALSKASAKTALDLKNAIEGRKLDFLNANATRYHRVSTEPKHAYRTDREMNGKYGWFDSTYKSYNMPEYFSGWAFETAEKLDEFYQLSYKEIAA